MFIGLIEPRQHFVNFRVRQIVNKSHRYSPIKKCVSESDLRSSARGVFWVNGSVAYVAVKFAVPRFPFRVSDGAACPALCLGPTQPVVPTIADAGLIAESMFDAALHAVPPLPPGPGGMVDSSRSGLLIS